MKKIAILFILSIFILSGCNNGYESEYITSFSFLKSNNSELSTDVYGEIDYYEITLIVPSNTDLTTIVATFETNAENVAIWDTLEYQISGETQNDFSISPLQYILSPVEMTGSTAEGGVSYFVKAGCLIDSNSFNDPQIYSAIVTQIMKEPVYSYDFFSFDNLSLDDSISDLTGLELLGGLDSLSIYFDYTTEISVEPISNLTNLSSLKLNSAIKFSDVQLLSNLTNLENLLINSCDISDISFVSGLSKLKDLDLRSNSISDISSLSGLLELKELCLSENDVTDISTLSNLTNLTSVSLGKNGISDFSPLSSIATTLEELYIDDMNSITLSQLSELTNLKVFRASNSNIMYIDELASLTNLAVLNLNYNDISVISSFSNLTNLSELFLTENDITDISSLSSLTKLKTLYLYNNDLTDITPLENLTNLEYLNIENNGMDISPGTENKTVVDILVARGCTVNYETGNTTD